MGSELFEEAWKQNRHVWESTKCLAQAMYLAGEKHQQSKVDDLQKRVDAIKGLIEDLNKCYQQDHQNKLIFVSLMHL